MDIIKYNSNGISKDLVLSKCKDNEDPVVFEMLVDWNHTKIDELNDAVDDYVEGGHLLCDISYKLIGAYPEQEELLLLATVADLQEYLDEDNWEYEYKL